MICSKCNKEFFCGVESGKESCWCFEYNVVDIPKSYEMDETVCLCSFCLSKLENSKKYKHILKANKTKNKILDQHNGK